MVSGHHHQKSQCALEIVDVRTNPIYGCIVRGAFGHIVGRGLERFVIWAIAVFVASFPSLYSASVPFSLDPRAMAWDVNQAGFFRDLFYVVITMSVLALANIWDNLLRRMSQMRSVIRGVTTLSFGFFIIALMLGTARFGTLSSLTFSTLPPAKFLDPLFDYDLRFIEITVAVSLLVELLIAYTDLNRFPLTAQSTAAD